MERRAGADPAGEAFLPEEALREEEALAGYTLWAARDGRREAELGRVARGLRADLTALRLPEGGAERWLHATVDLTMVEGEVVYEAGP